MKRKLLIMALVITTFIFIWKMFDFLLFNYYLGAYQYNNLDYSQLRQLTREEIYATIGSKNWNLLFVKTDYGIFRSSGGLEAQLWINAQGKLVFMYGCNKPFEDANTTSLNQMTVLDSGDVNLKAQKKDTMRYFVECKEKSATEFSRQYVSPNIGNNAHTYYLNDRVLLRFVDTNTVLVFQQSKSL